MFVHSLTYVILFQTFFASLSEAFGITLYIFQVLPSMDPSSNLVLPTVFMILPSFAGLFKDTKGYNLANKFLGWGFLIIPNSLVYCLLCLIILGIVPGGQANLNILWKLPLAGCLVSISWIPQVLQWQLLGKYTPSKVEKLDGKNSIHKKDIERTSLRIKHKILCAIFKCLGYPLAIFTIFVLFDGFNTWIQIQSHFGPAFKYHFLYHRMIIYFIVNIFTTFLSPLAIWFVYTAAIEFKVTKGYFRGPISGTFIVLLLTVVSTLCLILANVPCLISKTSVCCSDVPLWRTLTVAAIMILLFLGNLSVIYNVMIANHVILMPMNKVKSPWNNICMKFYYCEIQYFHVHTFTQFYPN